MKSFPTAIFSRQPHHFLAFLHYAFRNAIFFKVILLIVACFAGFAEAGFGAGLEDFVVYIHTALFAFAVFVFVHFAERVLDVFETRFETIRDRDISRELLGFVGFLR